MFAVRPEPVRLGVEPGVAVRDVWAEDERAARAQPAAGHLDLARGRAREHPGRRPARGGQGVDGGQQGAQVEAPEEGVQPVAQFGDVAIGDAGTEEAAHGHGRGQREHLVDHVDHPARPPAIRCDADLAVHRVGVAGQVLGAERGLHHHSLPAVVGVRTRGQAVAQRGA
ncbi:hypothetical protein [Embleya scabrispora]|uniref:hypothetical protein n=1 Tax=Embleya scabrispora TaxID=159449 RepID=UPI001FE22244|nr:hypothetical protein [Embleya scabrispora]